MPDIIEKIIHIDVVGGEVNPDPTAEIICHNKHKYVAEFSFDKEWESQSFKTAVFVWETGREEVVFSGNTCLIPKLARTQMLVVGVYAGDLISTSRGYIPCKFSILDEVGSPPDPTPDVYNQLMAQLNKIIEQGGIEVDLSKFQLKRDNNLETESKEIVGAINEVNKKVAEGVVVEETDPTVPDWAKQPNKPTYSYDEIENAPQFDLGSDFELVEKVVIGYSVLTEKPQDWETNYGMFYINTGTIKNPVYTQIPYTIAPSWEAGKYYSYDSGTRVRLERITKPDGTPYDFSKIWLYTNSVNKVQVTGYAIFETDYVVSEKPRQYYGAQVNVQRWSIDNKICHTIAMAEIVNGRISAKGGYVEGDGYSVLYNNFSDASIIYNTNTFWDKEVKATCITKVWSNNPLMPNTEIYIFGAKDGASVSVGGGSSDGTSLDEVKKLLESYQKKSDETLETQNKQVALAINELLFDKQAKEDNTLETDSKKIVGAINEINSATKTLSPYKMYTIDSAHPIHQYEFMTAPNGEVEIWAPYEFAITYPEWGYTVVGGARYFKAVYYKIGDSEYQSSLGMALTDGDSFQKVDSSNPGAPFTITSTIPENGEGFPDDAKLIFIKFTPIQEA